MAKIPPVFTDGEAYERMMGKWSRLADEIFLELDISIAVGASHNEQTNEFIMVHNKQGNKPSFLLGRIGCR